MTTMTPSTHWYALYTKPKNEKMVAQQLEKLGVEVYCPLIETVKIWSDRKKKVKEPLFKSYIFVKLTVEERDVVFQAHGVVRYVFWLGKPAVIRDEEILAIRDFLQETGQMAIQGTITYQYLQEVNITQGPLKGATGKFLYRNKSRLVLQIDSLGVNIRAELHQSQVV